MKIMNTSVVLMIILLIQISNIAYLIYMYKLNPSHIPSALIVLTISAILNFCFIIFSAFFFDSIIKNKIWILSIIISLLIIITTIIVYLIMLFYKYK